MVQLCLHNHKQTGNRKRGSRKQRAFRSSNGQPNVTPGPNGHFVPTSRHKELQAVMNLALYLPTAERIWSGNKDRNYSESEETQILTPPGSNLKLLISFRSYGRDRVYQKAMLYSNDSPLEILEKVVFSAECKNANPCVS